jgi:hypothetical protein
MTAPIICEACFLDAVRNGVCSNPGCDRFGRHEGQKR